MPNAPIDLTHVLSPGRIGTLDIRNRVVRSAHTTAFNTQGVISQRFIDYHAARGRGGVGLSILEIAGVHPSSPGGIWAWTDDVVDGYRRLMAEIRPTGMKVFQQLWHGGAGRLPLDGSPPLAPSAIAIPMYDTVAREMTVDDIAMIVACYASAARRAKEGGLDGVEIHGGHTYLVQQFLSPLTNLRNDDYGGSFENRLRFCVDVLTAIRAAVGPGFPVGIRLSDEDAPGGLTPQDNQRVASALEARGLVDFLDLSLGGYFAFPKMIGGMHERAGYEMPTSAVMGAGSKLPRLVTGRIRTLAEADRVIAAGEADFVSMVRATIADPDLVRKSAAGRAAEVRPCVACNQLCVGGLFGRRGHVGCAVNAAVARDREFDENALDRAAVPRRVVVVGGGPSGMEAARIAAARGHRVTLFDAAAELGGTMALARRAPTRAVIGDIVDWQAREVKRLGVDVRLGRRADAALVLAERPDVVVVATGAEPRLDGWQVSKPGASIPGIERPHVISSRTLLAPERNVAAPATAIVYDDVGHYEAIAAAEFLAERGTAVTFVTRCAGFAPLMEPALMVEPALRRLRAHDIDILVRARLRSVEEGHCTVEWVEGGKPRDMPAELVVFVSFNKPEDSLARDLRGRVPLHLVGDANGPRYLEGAIADGHKAGRAIG